MQRALAQPDTLTSQSILSLQRTYGNQFVQRLMQPELTAAESVQRAAADDVVISGVKFDRNVIPKAIHQGQQDKHIKTSNNYKNAVKAGTHKSAMTVDPAALLASFHTDSFKVLAYDAVRKSAVVDFDSDIGEVIDQATGTVLNTTKYGSIRHGGGGVHIIPINYTP